MSDPDVKRAATEDSGAPPVENDTTDSPRRQDSPRKEELLRRSLEYIAENSLADLSLRPLAKAIGSSPRVLLYLFGSKDELIRDVLALNREEQLRVLRRALDGSDDAGQALQSLWEWIIDPARDNVRRLFLEAYVRSPGAEGTWRDFAVRSVDDWLESFQTVLARDARRPSPDPGTEAGVPARVQARTDPGAESETEAETSAAAQAATQTEATVILAVVRGLVLDLLASGDRERVDRAWRRFLADRPPAGPARKS